MAWLILESYLLIKSPIVWYKSGLNYSKCQISVYYKYGPDASKLVLLSYVYDCVYWYKYEELGKWFVDTLWKRFNFRFLGYKHWFMSIRISQLKGPYISVHQYIYTTYVVTNYLDTATIK